MSTISAGTTLTTALVQTGDTTGNLVIKTGSSNTTAMTISGSDQSVTIVGTLTANGSSITPSQWTTSGSNIYYSTGNVGIGTSSPAQKFEVYNAATNSQCYGVFQNNRARNAAVLTKTTNGGFYTGTSIGTDTLCWQVYDESAGERMRIDSSGNVGIGTSSPAYKVDIVSTGNDVLKLSGGASATLMQFNALTTDDYAFGTVTSLAGLGIKNLTDDRYDFFISDDGNVGIGTSSPASKLEVRNGAVTAGATAIVLNGRYDDSYPTSGAGYFQLRTNNVDVTSGGLSVYTLNAGTLRLSYIAAETGSGNSYHAWNTSGSERMRIDSSGNVGIGTSSPASDGKLSVESNGSASSEINISLINGISNKECIVNFGNNLATAGRYKGRIYYQVDNNVMGFWTNTTERMRLDSSGNLLFNSGYGSVATAYGCRAWANFASNGSTLRASGGITSITVPSTGNITVNLSFTMPDTNYMYNVNTGLSTSAARSTAVTINCSGSTAIAPTTTAFSIGFLYGSGFTAANSDYINISVHR